MLYLDTSFVAPLVLNEEVSSLVESYLAKHAAGSLAVSQWTRVEFAGLVTQGVRAQHFSPQTAASVLAEFEALLQESCQLWLPSVADYDLARSLLTHFELGLREGGALHLAIAKNRGAERILTLDAGLLKAAKSLKIPATRGIR